MKLGVNIDHIATLRQARKEGKPDIAFAAAQAAAGGADGLTVHLRQDRRHIQDEDVYLIRKLGILPLNLEMAAAEEIIKVALDVRPASVCIVPEKREELTTEGGLDAAGSLEKIRSASDRLKTAGIKVSLFIDAEKEQIDASVRAGADMIELHTGKYANSAGRRKEEELNKVIDAAEYASRAGLKVNAGHGLDYENTAAVAGIEIIEELNIGYSIICEAVFCGLSEAVRRMKQIMEKNG